MLRQKSRNLLFINMLGFSCLVPGGRFLRRNSSDLMLRKPRRGRRGAWIGPPRARREDRPASLPAWRRAGRLPASSAGGLLRRQRGVRRRAGFAGDIHERGSTPPGGFSGPFLPWHTGVLSEARAIAAMRARRFVNASRRAINDFPMRGVSCAGSRRRPVHERPLGRQRRLAGLPAQSFRGSQPVDSILAGSSARARSRDCRRS